MAELIVEKEKECDLNNSEMENRTSQSDEIEENCNSNMQTTINILSDDSLRKVFTFLQINEKIRIERVCKRWKDISKRSWQNIKNLDDSEVWGFEWKDSLKSQRENILKMVLQRCGNFIRHFNSREFFMPVNNKMLCMVVRFCPNLQYLDTSGIELTISILKILSKYCHNLIGVRIGESLDESIKDSHLSEFLLQNKQLKCFQMLRNSFFTGECLLSLPVKIDSIIVDYCANISFNYMSKALQQFEQLQMFIMSYPFVKEDLELNLINSIPTSLKTLEIPGYLLLDNNCTTQMKNLEKLVIDIYNWLTDSFLVALADNCKNLCHLELNGPNYEITDIGIGSITKLPKLKHLRVENLTEITDDAFTYIPNLQTLILMNCKNIQDNGLCTLLESCDSIELLDVSHCSQITNALVECAMNVTKKRTNNLILRLTLMGTSVDFSETSYSDKSPLLIIVEEEIRAMLQSGYSFDVNNPNNVINSGLSDECSSISDTDVDENAFEREFNDEIDNSD